MSEYSQSYFAMIPSYILDDPNLDDATKILFGRISSLSNKEGFCFASDKYLAEKSGCSVRELKKRLKTLEDGNYIKRETKKEGLFWDRKIYPNFNYEGSIRPLREEHTAPSKGSYGPHINISTKYINEEKEKYKKEKVSECEEGCASASRADALRPPPNKSPKIKKSDIGKEKFGEMKNVLLFPEEHDLLVEKLGKKKADEYIEKLDLYVGSKGKKYSSHYATILSWHKKDNSLDFPPPRNQKEYEFQQRMKESKEYFDSNPDLRNLF